LKIGHKEKERRTAMLREHVESPAETVFEMKLTGPTTMELACEKLREKGEGFKSKRTILNEIEKSIEKDALSFVKEMERRENTARDEAKKHLALKIITGCPAMRNNVHLSVIVPLLNAGILKESDSGEIKGWNKQYITTFTNKECNDAVTAALSQLISHVKTSEEIHNKSRISKQAFRELISGKRGRFTFNYLEKSEVAGQFLVESDGNRVYPINSTGSRYDLIIEMKKARVFLLIGQLKSAGLSLSLANPKRQNHSVLFHKWLREASR